MSDVGKYYEQAVPNTGAVGTSFRATVASISGATVSFSGTPFGATDYTGYTVVLEGQTGVVASNTSSALTLEQALQWTVPTPSFTVNDRTGNAQLSGTTTLIGAGATYSFVLYSAGDTAYVPNMGHPAVGKGVARFCTVCQVPYREDAGMVRFRGLWYCKDDVGVAAAIFANEKKKAWVPKGRFKEPADSPFIVVQGPPPNEAT